MSHFSVAIFTKNNPDSNQIDNILAPFWEEREVPPYVAETKEQAIARIREEIDEYAKTGCYAQWKKNPKKYEAEHPNSEHLYYLKNEFPKKLTFTDDDCYKEAIRYTSQGNIDHEGNLISTRNPDSKWDWYEIGGRWNKLLALKRDVTKGNPNYTNSALVSNIDFEAMREKAKREIEPFEDCFERQFYSSEYFNQMYPTKDNYINRKTTFSTFSVITPDGKWHEEGEMWWFGLSTSTPEESVKYINGYYETFVKPAISNGWFMTIVDCHI